MWWKKNRPKLIAAAVILAVLAVAFWYGGDAPGMQGWTVGGPAEATPPAVTQTAEPTTTPDTPDISQQPEETPQPAEPTGQPEDIPKDDRTEQEEEVPQPSVSMAPDAGADPYLTDPVPSGKPLPVEPQDMAVAEEAYTCTLSISCATVLDHMDWLADEKAELVPEGGWILEPLSVTFYGGESVFNVLQRTCKQQKIHMEFSDIPLYNSAYIEGIANLYEFDCGELSGWSYQVNEWFPNYGCSRYELQDGDVISWVYTCDLGVDVGGSNAMGG